MITSKFLKVFHIFYCKSRQKGETSEILLKKTIFKFLQYIMN